jgi:CTP-dependent riboflavin kinase
MTGIFCETFGNTVRNRIIENLLIYKYTGMAIPDLAEESGISKQRAYQIMEEFEKKGYVKKYRVVRKTQLWVLNKENTTVNVWESSLKECMKILSNEYREKYSDPSIPKTRMEAK